MTTDLIRAPLVGEVVDAKPWRLHPGYIIQLDVDGRCIAVTGDGKRLYEIPRGCERPWSVRRILIDGSRRIVMEHRGYKHRGTAERQFNAMTRQDEEAEVIVDATLRPGGAECRTRQDHY